MLHTKKSGSGAVYILYGNEGIKFIKVPLLAQSMAEVKTYQGKIARIVDETEHVKTYHFDISEDMNFKPGQFVMLSLDVTDENGVVKPVKRAYSIASAPHEKELALTIKIYSDGKLSSQLGKYGVSDVLALSGPYGKFTFEDPKVPVVFIVGGTGIAPMRSMWKSVLNSGSGTQMQLLYSTRHEEEIIYAAELEALKEKMASVVTITRPSEGYSGLTGRIDRAFIEKHVQDPKSCMFYICGAPGMVRDMKETLAALEVDKEQIFHEAW
jgi:glycine betaine catabolism B